MKAEGRCIFCGADFTYWASYMQQSDYSIFGGEVCHDCDKRGLGFFTYHLKKEIESLTKEAINAYAKIIQRRSNESGDWWDKKSALFQYVKLGDVQIVAHYGPLGNGIPRTPSCVIPTTKKRFYEKKNL